MLSGVRHFLRESQDLQTVLARPWRVVIYSEDAYSWLVLGDYARELADLEPLCLTSDPHDPWPGALYLRRLLPGALQRLRCDVLLMTMPELGKYHLKAPPGCRTFYAFHSLNSIMASYRPHSFDHYTDFLCAGPHHVSELRATLGDGPRLHQTGYPKLDGLARRHAGARERTVLLAPSWHPGNLFEACPSLATALLEAGYRVVARPHPCFLNARLYPKGPALVKSLQALKHERFRVDLDFASEQSFHEAAVMVSDWSGAAPEFALGTLRPVLFVPTPRKVFNPDWQKLPLECFEDVIRGQIGEIVAPGDVVAGVERLLARDWRERLQNARSKLVYRFGESAPAGAEAIRGALSL